MLTHAWKTHLERRLEQHRPCHKGRTWLAMIVSVAIHCSENISLTVRQEKGIKGIQVGKEEIELSLFPDDMIVYGESSTESTEMTNFRS